MLKTQKGMKREGIEEAEGFWVNEDGGVSQQSGSIFLAKFLKAGYRIAKK